MSYHTAHHPLRLASLALAAAAALGLAAGWLALLSQAAPALAHPPEAALTAADPHPAAPAATIVVTHTGNMGFGSLRAAINFANAVSGTDTITFNLSGCPCVITLATTLPEITEALTITGPGAGQLAVDGNSSVRVLETAAVPVSISGLTIRNGATATSGGGLRSNGPLTLTDVHVLNNTAVGQGGGLDANDTLFLYGGVFRANQSTGTDGGALVADGVVWVTGTRFISNTTGAAGYGGAIFGDTLIATGAWFERNHAAGEGGALYLNTLVLTDTVILSNTAAAYGGGAYGSDTQISGGEFVGNVAGGDAGGLGSGPLVMSGTTFLRNSAAGHGGGLYAEGHTVIQGAWFEGNHAGDEGGAVHTGSPLTITASAFIDNRADTGGALDAASGWLANVLLAGNAATSTTSGSAINISTAGALHLAHLTVVGTGAPNSRAIVLQSGATVMTNTIFTSYTIGLERRGGTASEDYSLFFNVTTPTSGTVGGGAQRVIADPLFVNPGTGDYHLTWGSPALNVGTNAGVTTDYDGEARPQEGGFDLGFDELFVRRLYLPQAVR